MGEVWGERLSVPLGQPFYHIKKMWVVLRASPAALWAVHGSDGGVSDVRRRQAPPQRSVSSTCHVETNDHHALWWIVTWGFNAVRRSWSTTRRDEAGLASAERRLNHDATLPAQRAAGLASAGDG